ncbi:MAG TPA: GspE/PulE family protein [Victivallales bacterium]|nr:GspE/PulE family protein [Victivallales bacterium]HPO91555.1 GspE/PulE family protein [Victivallales bacterium]HRU01690.1 GspE/PulE family protein [Victivallales bacterium]
MNQEEKKDNSQQQKDLFQILEEKKIISFQQADIARRRMKREGIAAHQALLELNFCRPDEIYSALSQFSGLELVDLSKIAISEDAKKSVPAKAAHHFKFVPINIHRGVLTAAFANPPTLRDLENLRLLLGKRVEPKLAMADDVSNTLKTIYGLGAETVIKIRESRLAERLSNKEIRYQTADGEKDITIDEDSAPIINLVNQILVDALSMNATDIHIEPFHNSVKLRYRIDGMLQDIPVPEGVRSFHEAITSRLKIMADLNIAERRLPHDGRIRVRAGSEEFDLRVSIMPTRFGETICLRILNRKNVFLGLQELGLEDSDYKIFLKLIELPHGIILVTGPTGSGKTTTLYAALAKIAETRKDRKIITVEDPVEYEMPGITQMQIHSQIGLTFASGLRSILRHDPDIILVGEIRDAETAEIAIRASLTGHLVFSTLHTNDSVGAVNRLIDIGIEPYLVASSLVACLAQRLVRRICPHCKIPDEHITPHIRAEIARFLKIKTEDVRAFKGEGCSKCNFTGYKGRIAIYEFFLLDEELQDMTAAHASSSELRKTAKNKGMKTLREDGWIKLSRGLTSIEEVSRITGNFIIGYDMGEL